MIHRLAEQFGDIAIFAGAALIFGIVQLLLLPGSQPVKVYLASLAASVPVGTLTGITITTFNGTDTFDAGSVSFICEG